MPLSPRRARLSLLTKRASAPGRAPTSAGPHRHCGPRLAVVEARSWTSSSSLPSAKMAAVPETRTSSSSSQALPCPSPTSSSTMPDLSCLPRRRALLRAPRRVVGRSSSCRHLPAADAAAAPRRGLAELSRLRPIAGNALPRAHHYGRCRFVLSLSVTHFCLLGRQLRKMHLLFAFSVGARFWDAKHCEDLFFGFGSRCWRQS